MRHSVFIALSAFAFAMIFGLRAAHTTTLYRDLYLAQLCVGCTSLIYDITKPADRQMSTDKTTDDLSSCLDYGELYCGTFSDNLSAEAETEIMKFVDAQLRSKISDLAMSVGYQSESQENRDCTYLETKLRDPERVREECDNIEPDPEHSEVLSVLTLTIVSVISFSLIAGIWLLHRSFRNWQLRNMILRGKAASHPPNS